MNKLVLLASLVVATSSSQAASSAPYPRSEKITGIVFQQDTLERHAPGSDIWSCAWASDDHIYAAYGDGGGFDGTDKKGRVSIGVSRLEGSPPSWRGSNIWGGFNPQSVQPATTGKGTIAAVDNLLYLFVSEQSKWDQCRLWKSSDHGKTWMDRGWIFPQTHKAVAFPAIIEFGQAQSLNKEEWIYGFSDNSPFRVNDHKLYLFRVRRDQIEKTGSYQFFAGTLEKPSWSNDIKDKQPIFENAEGISWGTTCVYHPATKRFLLAVNVSEKTGKWGLYESEHPWGPWRSVAFGSDLPEWTSSPAEKERPSYLHSFPAKWMNADGKTLWCVFDRGDHFNLARCALSIQ